MKHQKCLAYLTALALLMGALAGCAGIPSRPIDNGTGSARRVESQDPTQEPEKPTGGETAEAPEAVAVPTRANGKSYLEYEVILQGDGVGDHPAFEDLTLAKEALASIGITLTIVDTDDSAAMQQLLAEGGQDLWAAAWPSNQDPDLIPLYHSGSIPGRGGSGSNYYRLEDPALDARLEEAQGSGTQAQRRALYRQCLETVMDWAVEIPDYQRRGLVVFNNASVDTATVSPDLTRYWDWTREAEKLAMNGGGKNLRLATGSRGRCPDPFYAVSPHDLDVVSLTQLSTLTTDRQGAVVANAIDGETRGFRGTAYRYTGPADVSYAYDAGSDTTTYTIRLRKGITFADGSEATADDLLFALYVLADPSYTGPKSLTEYRVLGLEDYRTQTTPEIYERYAALFDRLYPLGPGGDPGEDGEAAQKLWALQEEIWLSSIRGIVEYAVYNYLSYADSRYGGGFTAKEIEATPGLRTAFAMALWGYGSWDGEGKLRSSGGQTWDCKNGETPDERDFFAATYQAYQGDLGAYAQGEDADGADLVTQLRRRFIREMAAADPAMEQGVKSIEGIRKADDYTVKITTQGFSSSAIYGLCDIPIVPMRYYSQEAESFNVEENHFGVIFGHLEETLRSEALAQPLGAGPFTYDTEKDGYLRLKRNEQYWRGQPALETVTLVPVASAEIPERMTLGELDCGALVASKAILGAIAEENGGESSGSAITTVFVDNFAYGYIGLNAASVAVNGEPDSQASLYLRRALATVIAAFRGQANRNYFGEAAVTAEYPLAGSNWAAPQPGEEKYREAYSVDIKGDPIYTPEMTMAQRENAALKAALAYLEAAGFTVVGGVVTEGPRAPGT